MIHDTTESSSTASRLRQLPTYTAIELYFDAHPEGGLQETFAAYCEAFIAELEALVDTHPGYNLENLEQAAAAQIEARLARWSDESLPELPIAWLLPWFRLPWAARFVREAAPELEFAPDEAVDVPEPGKTYLRLQPGVSEQDVPNSISEPHDLHEVTRQCFERFRHCIPQLQSLEKLWLGIPENTPEAEQRRLWRVLSQHKKLRDLVLWTEETALSGGFVAFDWPYLVGLELRNHVASSENLRADQSFSSLQQLSMMLSPVGGDPLGFLTTRRFPAVRQLGLYGDFYEGVRLSPALVDEIVALPSLTSLQLQTDSDAATLSYLAAHLPQQLEALDFGVREHQAEDHLLEGLLQRAPFRELRSLHLRLARLSDHVFERFASCARSQFPALKELRLWFDDLGQHHIEQLCASPMLAQLSTFKLESPALSAQDARRLANSEAIATLSSLFIRVDDMGAFDLTSFLKTYRKQSNEERMASLREILDDESTLGWDELCNQLDEWEDEQALEEIVLPYTETHLAGVPAEERALPDRWLERLHKGEDFPALQLIQEAANMHTAKSIRAVSASRFLCNLRTLRIQCKAMPLQQELIERLVQAPFWKQLETFSFFFGPVKGEPFVYLCQQLGNTALRSLSIFNFSINPPPLREAIAALASSGVFDTLRDLTLSDLIPDAESWELLSHTTGWEQMEELTLKSEFHSSGWLAPIVAHFPPQLKRLNLAHCQLGEDDLATLVEGAALLAMEELELYGNLLHELHALSKANWPSLRQLYLHHNDLSLEGLRRLLESPFAGQLTHLGLSNCGFSSGQPWIELIAGSPQLANLESLTLYNNQITQAQCEILSASPHLKIKKTASEWWYDNI